MYHKQGKTVEAVAVAVEFAVEAREHHTGAQHKDCVANIVDGPMNMDDQGTWPLEVR